MLSRLPRWTSLLLLSGLLQLSQLATASTFAPPAHHAVYAHLRSLEGMHEAGLQNRANTELDEAMAALTEDYAQLQLVIAGLTPELPELKGVRNSLGWGQDPSAFSRVEKDGKRHYYFVTNDFDRKVHSRAWERA